MTTGDIMVIELAVIGLVDIAVAIATYAHWGDRQYPYKRKEPR